MGDKVLVKLTIYFFPLKKEILLPFLNMDLSALIFVNLRPIQNEN